MVLVSSFYHYREEMSLSFWFPFGICSFIVIYNKLEKQNTAIYEREQQLASVEKEFAGAKGIFKAKQRKELQEQAEQLKVQIASMKQYLSSIVQGYGYKNVKEFLAEYGSIPNSV